MRYPGRTVAADGQAKKSDDELEHLQGPHGMAKDLLPLRQSVFQTSTGSAYHNTASRSLGRDSMDSFALSPSASTLPLQNVVAGSQQAFASLISSWASRKFMQGCAILFPIAFTFYVSWWVLAFFDQFFSPLYFSLFGFHVFGLGFITSMLLIFLTGVFLSTWLGSIFLGFGEWVIVQLPIIKQVYSASKQVSNAIRPDNEAGRAFQECVLIRHPRNGSHALAFVTGTVNLQVKHEQPTKLFVVYVPTNHVYLGDVLLLPSEDIVHTDLTVAQGMEAVVSMGMAIPETLTGRVKGGVQPEASSSGQRGKPHESAQQSARLPGSAKLVS